MAEQHGLHRVALLALTIFAQRAPAADDLPRLPERIVNTLGIEMVLIRGGAFEMGFGKRTPDRFGPAHPVELSPYYFARTEVTKGQFRQFSQATGVAADLPELEPGRARRSLGFPSDWNMAPGEEYPIFGLPWSMAAAFCTWLAQVEQVGYRLPTEAEWEFAARGGSDKPYWWGRDGARILRDIGRIGDGPPDSYAYGHLSPVGAYSCNPYGIYDLLGNAGEKCQDFFDWDYYINSPVKDPTGPTSGTSHVSRGGCFYIGPPGCSPFFRHGAGDPDTPNGGIRLALPIRDDFTLPKGYRVPDPPPPCPDGPHITHTLPCLTIPINDTVTMDLLRLEPGEFLIGSPQTDSTRGQHETPQTLVRMTKPYHLGRYEVTQAQWEGLWPKNASYTKGPTHPVERVDTTSIGIWCQLLVERHRRSGILPIGAVYRMPTPWEWEYACRAGSTTKYSFGDDPRLLSHYAWYDLQAGSHPVGEKLPNAWGFYDMHGNVWELMEEMYSYPGGTIRDIDTWKRRFAPEVRGGSWNYGAVACRSAMRQFFSRGGNLFTGFRLARIVPREPRIEEVPAGPGRTDGGP